MPVSDPNSVDLVTRDPRSGEVALIMVEDRPWDGSEARMAEVQAKANAYLAFALDGQLPRAFPEARGQPLRVQLDCVTEPDPATAEFLAALGAAVEGEGVRFVVNVLD